MTSNNRLLKYIAFLGVGVSLAGALWVRPLVAQPSARDDATDPPITSAPDQNLQENGGIDYGNAKPMPLPSVPGPAPSEILPPGPSPGLMAGHPGSSPGSIGSGEENPQVLVPPEW
jgi:hypothetical protein